MKAKSSSVALGSKISAPPAQESIVAHRLRAAWKSYMGVNEQLMLKHTPHHQRFALMDGVLLPSRLWGSSRWSWSKRSDIVWTPFRGQSSGECCGWYNAAGKNAPHWGKIQKCMYFNFRGHVGRMSTEHEVLSVTRWRNSEWWLEYKARLPAKTGGQQGIRPQDRSNPCRDEAPMRKALTHARSRAWWPTLEEALRGAGIPEHITWRAIVQICGAWRAFGRWAAFRTKM